MTQGIRNQAKMEQATGAQDTANWGMMIGSWELLEVNSSSHSVEHSPVNGHIHRVTKAMVELGAKSQESDEVSSTFNCTVIVRLIGQAKFGRLHKLYEGRDLSESQYIPRNLLRTGE